MAVYRDHRSGAWRYRATVRMPDGSLPRISGKPPVNTKQSAEMAERAHIQRLLDPPKPPKKEAPKLKDYAEEFMKTYVLANNKPSEQHTKRVLLDAHILPALGSKKLDEIGQQEVDGLRALLKEKGNQPKSINNVIAVLTRILSYARANKVITELPTFGKLKVIMPKVDFLTDEELEATLAALAVEPMLQAAVLLGANAGLRRGEIRALRWEDVDLKGPRPQLTVRRSLWKDEEGTPKGGRERTIPLSAQLQAALKGIRHLSKTVIATGQGETWTKNMAESAIARICRVSGLRPIGWHTLRHTFCSHLAMRGAPVRTIQELAGHADLATTLRYMHLAPTALVEAVALLDRRDNRLTTEAKNQEATQNN